MRKVIVSLCAFALVAGHSSGHRNAGAHSQSVVTPLVVIEDAFGIRVESLPPETNRASELSSISPLDVSYDGCWTGSSSVGTVTLLVQHNALTYVRVEIGPGATCSSTASVTVFLELPLSGNSFDINAGATLRIRGSFESTASANGTLSYSLISGCSGTSQWTASSLIPTYMLTTGDGSLLAAATVGVGESMSFDITATPFNGFSAPAAISLNVFGINATGPLPRASISSTPIPQGQTAQLSVTVPLDTPPGSYRISVQGSAAGIVRTLQISLNVLPAQGFSILLPVTSSKMIYTGGPTGGVLPVLVLAAGGFSDSIHLSASVSPPGGSVSASLTPADLVGGGASALSISINGNTPGGTFMITLTGTSGQNVSRAAMTLEVVRDFDLEFDPEAVVVSRGTAAKPTLTITRIRGFAGAITVAPQTEVAGIKVKPREAVTTESSLKFKIRVSETAPTGLQRLVFTGRTDSGETLSAVLTLIVQ